MNLANGLVCRTNPSAGPTPQTPHPARHAGGGHYVEA